MHSAADRLRENKNRVLTIWESYSRNEIEAAKNKDSHTVRNELIHFLDALTVNLRTEQSNSTLKEKTSAEHHGQQRAGLTGYTLAQTIREYSLLRSVIIEFLVSSGPLSEIERRIVHDSIDQAIQFASNEFAQSEQSKLKLALAKAEASNRDLDQFSAVAAHDLRSPLNSIAGFTSLLKEEFGTHASSDAREYMDFIENAVKRMTSLIEGILNYSKLNSVKDELSEIRSVEAVQAATQNLKGALTESSGRIGHADLPSVLGNLPLLSQLFQNLFSNAIRYRSEKPPEIEVSAEREEKFWHFRVKDNGKGFDPKFKDVIFEVNKQLDGGTLGGAGLGLATCRKVVELHGGKIWAESAEGRGSTFHFTIPAL